MAYNRIEGCERCRAIGPEAVATCEVLVISTEGQEAFRADLRRHRWITNPSRFTQVYYWTFLKKGGPNKIYVRLWPWESDNTKT